MSPTSADTQPSRKEPLDIEERRARTRSVLACALVLLCALGIVLAVVLSQAAREQGLGVAQQQSTLPAQLSADDRTGPLVRGPLQTKVPALVELLGLTRSQAIELLGRGARVIDEQGEQRPFGQGEQWVVEIALAEEVADGQEGPPRVRLGLDETDRVRSAEYSVALESLGYSKDLSFRQAINLMHVVEDLLIEAGISVPVPSVRAPKETQDYTSYLDDGTTVSNEHAEFSGKASVEEVQLSWQASLDYDYEESLKTGNLADAHHIISILVAS